jgi:hypothetical protein
VITTKDSSGARSSNIKQSKMKIAAGKNALLKVLNREFRMAKTVEAQSINLGFIKYVYIIYTK